MRSPVPPAVPRRTSGHKTTRIVVVGAGWIGSEVAASSRQLGKEVALVEAAGVPLERVPVGHVLPSLA